MKHTRIARRALASQAWAIRTLARRIDIEFEQCVEMLLACQGRVIVAGIGKSGLIGRKLAATLASTGTPSFFLHPGEAFHGDLGMVMKGDLAILLSYSGETDETIKLIPFLKSMECKIVALTADRMSSLGANSDVFLDISVSREVCPNNLAPTTSTLATMAMGDAIAVALIKARDFQPNDFARFHPGGSLGRRLLTRACDVMQKTLPVVSAMTTFQDCLFTMTKSRMGLSLVMEGDTLLGIITDGDIRRAIQNGRDVLNEPVDQFMTRNPVTIPAQTSLAEAENLMAERKIRALIVTDDQNKVIGILEVFSSRKSFV